MLRNNRRLQTAMRSSRLPAVKTLDQFDLAFQPGIKRKQIESLQDAVHHWAGIAVLRPPSARQNTPPSVPGDMGTPVPFEASAIVSPPSPAPC